MRSSSACPISASIVSIGQISSRTNARIHSSCCSNSGSVEKSQATASFPKALADQNSVHYCGLHRSRQAAGLLEALRQDFAAVDDAGLLAIPGLGGHTGVAQHGLLHLVRLGARQLVAEFNEARHPVARHALR